MSRTIITIDGPSGVGKGTMAQLLAEKYGFHLLDSGALYRLTAVNAKRLGLNHDDAHDAEKAVNDLAVSFQDGRVFLHDDDVSEIIRTTETAQLASKIAVHAVVRERLFRFMQDFVRAPGIVADGRDMGTVVFPQAHLKIFLTASAETRAERRYNQLKKHEKGVNLSTVFSALVERDKRDEARDVAPLEPAKDAVIIDTGQMDVLQVFEHIEQLVIARGLQP